MFSWSFVDYLETSPLFVDKSLLVRYFLHSPQQVSLIAYPHGWGKSVNLNMIATFLQADIDQITGEFQKYKNETRSFKLFANGELRMKILKEKLKISEDREFIERHLAEYPVVLISLESIFGLNLDEVFAKFKREMSKLFKNFEFLSNRLSDISVFDRFQRFLTEQVDLSTSLDAIRFLCSVLFAHFGKKSFVLIDDYDAAILFSLGEPRSSPSDFGAIVNFVRKLIERTFIENQFLDKGLIRS